MCILRVFEHLLVSYDEKCFRKSRGIVDAKSEVSESGMNQFWPYLPILTSCEDIGG